MSESTPDATRASDALPMRRPLPSSPAGDEAMVRDPETGNVHFLNPVAAVVWECCDGSTALQDCERRIRSTFEVPEGVDVAADIRQTLADFAAKGMLDGPPANA